MAMRSISIVAVHGQVGTRARRKRAIERDFHRDRSLHRRRVGPDHVALDGVVVVEVDDRRPALRHVLGLGFRYAQHGLEAARLNDARQLEARLHVLPDLELRIAEGLKLARASGDRHAATPASSPVRR